MGREIRMVPPNWQHPQRAREHDTYGHGGYQPMYDRTFEEAAREWKDGLAQWEAGQRASYCDDAHRDLEYWEWDSNPPIRAYYRTYKEEDATWFQLWETVSEGTPVSPPFATKEELAQYLAAHGDDWDRKRGHGGWGIERARAFVNEGWAPSMVMIQSAEATKILDSKDVPLHFEQQRAAGTQ